MEKPRVLLIKTGGTIGQKPNADGILQPSPVEYIGKVEGLEDLAEIDVRKMVAEQSKEKVRVDSSQESPLVADFGEIRINDRTTLDVYVIDRGMTWAGYGTFWGTLSDGRQARGRIRDNKPNSHVCLVDRILQSFHLKKPNDTEKPDSKVIASLREPKTGRPYILGSEIDDATYKLVEAELLTRRCDDCGAPTRYELNFWNTAFNLGFSQTRMGYGLNACLDHLNATIEHEGKAWDVVDHISPNKCYRRERNLGTVKYDAEKHKFVSPSQIPSTPQAQPKMVSVAVNGVAIHHYERRRGIHYDGKSGTLTLGDKKSADDLIAAIGAIPPRGIDLVLNMPDGREKKLTGVKRIGYGNKV